MSKNQKNRGSELDDRTARLLMKIEVYLSYQLYGQAREALEELLEVEPDNLGAHTLRLQVLREDGDDDELLRQLALLAKLQAETPAAANRFLLEAFEIGDEDDVRSVAREIGLELNDVGRLLQPGYVEPERPAGWPFEPDALALQSCPFRVLTEPAEVRCLGDETDELFVPLARRLVVSAMSVPSADHLRAAFFMFPRAMYAVFTTEHFAIVHEYGAATLGRVYHRLTATEYFEAAS